MADLYSMRIAMLNGIMKEKGVSGIVICNSPNMYYLTGFRPHKCERLLTVVFAVDEEPLLIVPAIYEIPASRECCIKDHRMWKDGENVNALVENILAEKHLTGKSIAIDNTTEFGQFSYYYKASAASRFMTGAEIMSILRMHKSPEEAELMRESGRLTDEAIDMLIKRLPEGLSEADLQSWIEYDLSKKGMRQGFSNIICFGENSADNHHVPDGTTPKANDQVLLDIGGAYKHYWSDATRTLHIGKPSQKFIDNYARIKEAQQLAFESIRPGVRACDVDKVARDYLAKYDLAAYFNHRLGHGVGLDSHEKPNLSSDESIILEPGMSFSCEPGVYYSGEWGIRIEDTVMVTETGAESFNKFTKELIVL